MRTKFLKVGFAALFVAIFCVSSVSAADIAVRETGAGGAYNNINDAIAAASDGDRIIIEPRTGALKYQESLVIDKSLQFLCSNEGEKFGVEGNITITPATPLDISFIGMSLTGYVSANVDAPSSVRTTVKFLYCYIGSYMEFRKNNYDLTMANNYISGNVYFCSGRLFGNEIHRTGSTYNTILISEETSPIAPAICDTIQIIGNKIYNSAGADYYAAIRSTSSDYYYQIMNNFIEYSIKGIYITDWKPSAIGTNEIINNTFYQQVSLSEDETAIYCSDISVGGKLNVLNNLFDGNLKTFYSEYGIKFSNMSDGETSVRFNHCDSGYDNITSGIINDGSNGTCTFTLNITDGSATGGNVDAGHTDYMYYDLDLTRNDAGCYGGSLSYANFFLTTDANNNRIFNLEMPRRVIIGNPIKVKAEGFDK